MTADDDVQVAPRLPWRPEETRRICRGRVIVRLRDDRGHVPHAADVAAGALPAALRLDVEPVDRVVAAASPAMRVSRTFHAARNARTVGRRHVGYDALETELGMSRTYRIDVAPDTGLVELCAALADLEAVEMVSPVYLADCPFGDAAPIEDHGDWGHERVGSAAALAIEPGDPAVIVAVIDSGVADHVELRGRCRPGADLVDIADADVSRGIRLLGDHEHRDRAPDDLQGHGTGCAAIIAARGIALPRGCAGASPVLPMRALAAAKVADRPRPTALGTLPDIDAAVKLAVDLGARVLNLSFGTPESALREGDPVPHIEVIEYALARGCVLIAASGNSGDRTRYFPASLPGVIAVGAIGLDDRPATFTTRGDHVAISAPGVAIRTAGLDGIVVQNGTSFAAPFVAGAAALVLAQSARRVAPLTPYAVRDILVQSARRFDDRAGAAGCGAGILDIPAALRAADSWSHVFDDEVGEPPTRDRPRTHLGGIHGEL